MTAHWVSILALVVVFAVSTTMSVNMGALSFAAALLVGTTVAGLTAEEIFTTFPGSIFVVLVGVTYLFAIARATGTVDWLVASAVHLVRGRLSLIPWVMFGVAGVLTSIGAVSPAAVAIVAPIALRLAAKHHISPLLMGALVVTGAQAGGFSPISVYGAIVNDVLANEKVPGNEITLFLASLLVNSAVAAVMYLVCGGLRLRRAEPAIAGAPQPSPASAADGSSSDP
ncbi:MAG: SLC13 family permease, partial [Micromonosporaceae bacterium]